MFIYENTATLLFVLFLSLVNYGARYLRWSAYLEDGATRLPPLRHFSIYMAGFALTTTPAKAGEAMRTFYLKPLGVDHRRCLAALYTERIFDVLVISLLAMLIAAGSGTIPILLSLAGAGIVAGLLALQHPVTIRCLARLSASLHARFLRRALEIAEGFLGEVRSMMTRRLVVQGTSLGLLAWGAEAIGAYLVAREIGIDIGLALAAGIYGTAMLAGALSFLPGGLGSAEVAMVSLFVYAGASTPEAIAATAIIRLCTLWFAVVLGLIAWVGLEISSFRSRSRVQQNTRFP